MDDYEIEQRILHVLKIYTRISPSMLHLGIGTSVTSGSWRPVLDGLISNGEVLSKKEYHENISGKVQAYTVLSLPTAN